MPGLTYVILKNGSEKSSTRRLRAQCASSKNENSVGLITWGIHIFLGLISHSEWKKAETERPLQIESCKCLLEHNELNSITVNRILSRQEAGKQSIL